MRKLFTVALCDVCCKKPINQKQITKVSQLAKHKIRNEDGTTTELCTRHAIELIKADKSLVAAPVPTFLEIVRTVTGVVG